MKAVKKYVKQLFSNDVTGHDYHHMKRVANVAREIAKQENANEFICELGGWLHDVGDYKLFADPKKAIDQMEQFLRSIKLTNKEIQLVDRAIQDVSFSKGKIPITLEGKIVQDADRLDAIGAIGIARTFAYGGANNQLIYHDNQNKNTSIQHFYDKLLIIKDQLNTDYAKKIASERHQFMKLFLEQFYKEW